MDREFDWELQERESLYKRMPPASHCHNIADNFLTSVGQQVMTVNNVI